MKKLSFALGILIGLSAKMYAQTAIDIEHPLVEGQRAIKFSIAHAGVDAKTITASVYYSSSKTEVEQLSGGVSNGRAILSVVSTSESQALCILPHNDHPMGPNRDYVLIARAKGIPFIDNLGVPMTFAMPFDASVIDKKPIVYPKGKCVFYRIVIEATNRPKYMSEVASFTMPDTYNVGLVGDSYGSGEGSPNENFNILNPGNQIWTHNDCHRSNKSGLVRGIKKYIHENPEIAVDYLHTACSGAQINHLTTTQQTGGATLSSFPPVPVQFEVLKSELLQGRGHEKLHLLLMSIGGNNAGFGDFVKNYMIFPGNAASEQGLADRINGDLAALSEAYTQLDLEIEENFPFAKVALCTYPNPTNGPRGTCGRSANPADFALTYACCLDEVNLIFNPEAEYTFASQNFLVPMNQTIRNAASARGWSVMDMEARMATHGLCDCESPYINRLAMAIATQGDIFGIVHPTRTGFREVYSEPVANMITSRYQSYYDAKLFSLLLMAIFDPNNPELPKPCTETFWILELLRGDLMLKNPKLLPKLKAAKLDWLAAFIQDKAVQDAVLKGDEKAILSTEAYKKIITNNKADALAYIASVFPKPGPGSQKLSAMLPTKNVLELQKKVAEYQQTKEWKATVEKATSESKNIKVPADKDPLDNLYNRK